MLTDYHKEKPLCRQPNKSKLACGTHLNISLMKVMKRIGPTNLPWGTPYSGNKRDDMKIFYSTCQSLFVK